MPATRDPDWARDEIIVACDLVWANSWHELRAEYPQVIELSQLLNEYWLHPPHVRTDKFRNPNSVGRKTTDIATRHPDYTGGRTRGGRLDRDVLEEFLADPAEMHRQAVAIRALIRQGPNEALPTVDQSLSDIDGMSATEGGILEVTYYRRERNRSIRNNVVLARKQLRGSITCDTCGFDFGEAYGARGEDYIECHHKVPLSESGPTTTRPTDFALVCSNCHRMIHRKKPWLTTVELANLVVAMRNKAGGQRSTPSNDPTKNDEPLSL